MRTPSPLLSKLLLIAVLSGGLLIALQRIHDLVDERAGRRAEMVEEVARGHSGAQVVTGPVLWVPYSETFVRRVPVEGSSKLTREETVTEHHALTVFPRQLDTQVTVQADVRWRGLFPVTVYDGRHEGQARFDWRQPVARQDGGRIQVGQPLVLLGVTDPRGLRAAPVLQVGGSALSLAPVQVPAGPRPPLALGAAVDRGRGPDPGVLEVAWQFELAGTGSLSWVPLADENRVSLQSNWPHPSFGGSFLPRQREVRADGFTAQWSVPGLSSQAQQQFASPADPSPALERFSVSLVDPVDLYRLSDRATKYAVLFIGLGFGSFLVLELVRRWRIHPVQYLMVGMVLVLFYLLLLSLAEHLGFARAYALAAGACVLLTSHYLSHVLDGWRAGLGAGAALATLYGVLYGILVSEDNALVMGSLLLFALLAVAMVVTRRLDWYALTPAAAHVAPPTRPAPAQARPTGAA